MPEDVKVLAIKLSHIRAAIQHANEALKHYSVVYMYPGETEVGQHLMQAVGRLKELEARLTSELKTAILELELNAKIEALVKEAEATR